MTVGDEFGLSEDLYSALIGRYVATIEVLSKRIFAKDQHIGKLEAKIAELETEIIELKSKKKPKNGDVDGNPPKSKQ